MIAQTHSPFQLKNEQAYLLWRSEKLAGYPTSLNELTVIINDPANLSLSETNALRGICAKTNFAIYTTKSSKQANRAAIRHLCSRLGLEHLDSHLYADDGGISVITATDNRQQGEYIPYTTHAIGWHTDGYYNDSAHQIRGMVLHCVHPAGGAGGENMLLDHEVAYILMRDEDPAMVEALMQPDAMTIPANIVEGVTIRPEITGPVFSIDPVNGSLHMRYSARQRHVIWKDDPKTLAGADFLLNLWKQPPNYVFRCRLAAGEGVVSNNVLHGRTAFTDDDIATPRLLYRARSYDRIHETDFHADQAITRKIKG